MMNTNDDLADRVTRGLGQAEQAVAPTARTALSDIRRATIREVSDFLAREADWRHATRGDSTDRPAAPVEAHRRTLTACAHSMPSDSD